jgi:CRP-like cAMP-binding protein
MRSAPMQEGELGKLYPKGTVIFSEGDKGDVMYVIQTGSVRISKKIDGRDIDIALLGQDELLGEMALFDMQNRSATATVESQARILSVDKRKLFTTISREPTLAFKIIETMSKRIRKLNEDLVAMSKPKGLFETCFNVSTTCNYVLEEAKHLVQAENGSVMILDDQGCLQIKAAFGREATTKTELTIGRGIELVNDVTIDSRFIAESRDIRALLCLPLKCDGQPFGVINMSNRTDRMFTLDDLKILNSVSHYASLAIHNALSYENLINATDSLLRHATMRTF